jgi:hypothetical protein
LFSLELETVISPIIKKSCWLREAEKNEDPRRSKLSSLKEKDKRQIFIKFEGDYVESHQAGIKVKCGRYVRTSYFWSWRRRVGWGKDSHKHR